MTPYGAPSTQPTQQIKYLEKPCSAGLHHDDGKDMCYGIRLHWKIISGPMISAFYEMFEKKTGIHSWHRLVLIKQCALGTPQCTCFVEVQVSYRAHLTYLSVPCSCVWPAPTCMDITHEALRCVVNV